MNKEELNQEINKLKASLEAHESQVKDLQHDLKVAEQRLEDADKPKLTEKAFEIIQSAIESAVSGYRGFEEDESYEYEMSIEYDNYDIGVGYIMGDETFPLSNTLQLTINVNIK